MRKFYQDYSLIGVVLLFSAFFSGLFLRLFNLENVSSWSDELASLYYAKHINEVFLYESHTPFYYFICKIWMWVFPDSILSLRFLFISLSALIMSSCFILLYKKKGSGSAFIFLILWWLWPTDIVFSRQARHYSLYAEMTFLLLVLWDYRSEFSRKLIYLICTIFQLIHPLALIPVWYLVLYDWARGRASKKEALFFLTSSVSIFVYYGIRFTLYGSTRVFSNISWIRDSLSTFHRSLYLLFIGDSYPFTFAYPLSLFVGSLFLLIVITCFFLNRESLNLFFKKEKLLKFFQLYLITVIIVEIFSSLFTNIKIARYFIYLVPFLLYGLIDFVNETKPAFNLKLAFALTSVLLTYNAVVLAPWRSYEWDDQNVAEFKNYVATLPPKELVICSRVFQFNYYFNRPYETCTDAALRLHLKKQDFHLFDLNGDEKLLLVFLTNESKIEDYKLFNRAVFISVSYPRSDK